MNAPEYKAVSKDDVAFVGTGPVPVAPYHDPEYFEIERKAIFRRSWLHIGRFSEVGQKGQFMVRPIEVANASVLIVHGADGVLRAFYNVCSHRSTELVAQESGKASSFSCRYHMWTFGYDGALRGVPDAENFYDLDKSKCGLKPIAIETCAGFIFVNLDPAPKQSLRAFLGVWADRLEALQIGDGAVFSEYTYEVDANWKMTYDNYQEIYHGRFVHAKSLGEQTMSKENPFGYPTAYTFDENTPHRSKTLWFNPKYKPAPTEAIANQILRDAAAKAPPLTNAPASTEHFYIFPNLTLFSVQNRCFTQTIWPLAANRTRSIVRQYWEGKDENASMRFARERRVCNTLDVHSEDREIIEAAQRGMQSGAFDTLQFQVHEVMCRHFFHAVDTCVQAYKREQAGSLEAVA